MRSFYRHLHAPAQTCIPLSKPDGLIFHLFGPMEGRRADAFLFYKSNMDDILLDNLSINDVQYYIYGDQAYAIRPWLQVAFPRQHVTVDQLAFNTSMNKPRTAVEWSYGELKTTFVSQLSSETSSQENTCCVILYNISVTAQF